MIQQPLKAILQCDHIVSLTLWRVHRFAEQVAIVYIVMWNKWCSAEVQVTELKLC